MKEAGGENLLTAIRQVSRGEVYVSPKMSARILEGLSGGKPRGSSSPIEKLTDREFEIFQLIGQGKSTRDIAAQLLMMGGMESFHEGNYSRTPIGDMLPVVSAPRRSMCIGPTSKKSSR